MSIFISIASYRDRELPKTVESLYDNADNPEDLTFGIVNQNERNRFDDFSWLEDQVVLRNMHYKEARGAGFARKIAMEMYDGQDYFFQTDSHMRFAKGWDTKLKNMLKESQELAGTEKVILSQFPAPYTIFTDGSINYIKEDPDFWDDVSWTSVVNTWTGVWAGNREKMADKSKPHHSHTVLGALLFTTGKFVEEIPYDERISFMGEELCIAIRAYTRGWEMYAPNEMICWHFYKREDRPKIWNDNMANRKWTDIESNSQKVQESILLGIEEGVYGIGDYQRYLDYQKMININFESFYNKEIRDKRNLGVITQEMEFDDNFDFITVAKSGYCAKGLHSKCLAKEDCQCKCHGEVN
jgi:hypothetical protein